jgi:asparagine synthase (glutamine-hydrolysing)
MVIFAAIIAKQSIFDFDSLQENLTSVLSRDSNQVRHSLKTTESFFCYCGGGAFGSTPFIENEQKWLLCSGHPLLSDSFDHDLHRCLDRDALETLLLDAQGTFTFIQYDKIQRQFTCYCDALGIRPFYVYEDDNVIVLASALRVLEALELPLSVDQEAVIETVMLGYPLGDKTRYLEIKTAKPAEKRVISPLKNQSCQYFCWAEQHFNFPFKSKVFGEFQQKFHSVMLDYQSDDCKTISTLSGGLDSRLVVSELIANGCMPYCFNFSRPNAQDLHFACGFAATYQIPFFLEKVEDTQAVSVERQLGRVWRHSDRAEKLWVERPDLCWSGNGGSVCLGQVYFTNAIYDACQSGLVERVVTAFLDAQMAHISISVVKKAEQWQTHLRQALTDCLNLYPNLPLEKRFQLFLWENDQHRHCALAAEDADLFQLDFCHPFYAKGLLDIIWSAGGEPQH